MRICIPILAEREGEAMMKMARLLPEGSPFDILFELRIDRMEDIDLETLLREKKRKILVTNRRKEEGGGFHGSEKERISLIRQAVAFGADYVDIEASTDRALLSDLKAAIADQGNRTKLIVSHHDFQKPPRNDF